MPRSGAEIYNETINGAGTGQHTGAVLEGREQ
jgi:hypothetical protein